LYLTTILMLASDTFISLAIPRMDWTGFLLILRVLASREVMTVGFLPLPGFWLAVPRSFKAFLCWKSLL
jgi:hypothetical protein